MATQRSLAWLHRSTLAPATPMWAATARRPFSCCSSTLQAAATTLGEPAATSSSASSSQKLAIDEDTLHIPLGNFTLGAPLARSAEEMIVPLSKHVFGQPSRRDILHRCVVFEQTLTRSGSANTKTRSELAYSGRKLRQQKGTGRARLGSRSSPSLRKGATAHGPKPKDWSQGLPRKVWELGLRIVLSERWREGNLVVVPTFEMGSKEQASEELAQYVWEMQYGDAIYVSGSGWGGLGMPMGQADYLREALGRRHLIKDGIRLGQRGTWWENLERERILPILNSIDLAHPNDFAPGQTHPLNGWKPGSLGVYHLMLRKRVVMDLAALEALQDRLMRDLRRPIGALGTDPAEAAAWEELTGKTWAAASLAAARA